MIWLQALLEQPIVDRLGWTLVHSVWQIGLVAAVLAGVLAARPRSANARYLAACAGMLLMAAAPAVTFFLVEVPVEVPPIVRSVEPLGVLPDGHRPPAHVWGPLAGDPAPPDASPVLSGDVEAAAAGQTAAQAERETGPDRSGWTARVLPYLVAAWLAGVVFLSIRLLAGWLQAQRIRQVRTRPAAEPWQHRLSALARRLGVSRPVRLLESGLARVPAVIGHLRPVLLIPAGALTGLTSGQLEAIIAHELAHIRRWDYLVNLVQSAVEVLLFYHPGVWWVSRRIRRERENCCDDLASAVCGDRLLYARALADMEQLRRRPRAPALAVAAGGGSLLARVRRIVGLPDRSAPSPRWLAGVLVAVTLLAAGLIIYGCADGGRIGAPAHFNKAVVKLCVDDAGKHLHLGSGPTTTITLDDPDEIKALASFFPNVGTGRKSNTAAGWLAGMTVNFQSADGKKVRVTVSGNDALKTWSEGHGDWPVRGDLKAHIAKLRRLKQPAAQPGVGRVVDVNGKGIVGVTLRFSRSRETTGPDGKVKREFDWRFAAAKTDASGKFDTPGTMPGKFVSIELVAPGFVRREHVSLQRRADGTYSPDDGTIQLHREGTLTGRIIGPDGKPLPAAPLSLSTSQRYPHHGITTANHLRAITDKDGRFSIEGVPPGNHLLFYPWGGPSNVEVKSGRWKDFTRPGQRRPQPPTKGIGSAALVTLGDGKKLTGLVLDLSKSTCAVEGVVRDSTGRPVADARVGLYWIFGGGWNSVHSKDLPPVATDAQGRYRLTGLPPGRWHVRAWHDRLKTGAKPTPVQLTPDKTIRQNLTLPGKAPPPDEITGPATQPGEKAVRDVARKFLKAMCDKDDAGLKALSCDTATPGWKEALPRFAGKIRRHLEVFAKSTEPLTKIEEVVVVGDLATVKAASIKQGYLVLFFQKTSDGWRNCSLKNSPPRAGLAHHLKKFADKLKAAATQPAADHRAPTPATLAKWLAGKDVIEVCFAGAHMEPMKLRKSLKTKVPHNDDFRLLPSEGGGVNRSFVQVCMRVSPENTRRLLSLQEELTPRGYRLDPRITRVWSLDGDPKARAKARRMAPKVLAAAANGIRTALPKAKTKPEKLRGTMYRAGIGYEVPGTNIEGMIRITEITATKRWELASSPDHAIHLPRLGLMMTAYYRPGRMTDASPERLAIRKAVHEAIAPLLKLEGDTARLREYPFPRAAWPNPAPATIAERDRVLAAADAKIRKGIVELAEKFPQIKKARDWDHISRPSQRGRLGIVLGHTHLGKAKTVVAPVPENERFSVLVVIQERPSEPTAWSMFPIYPNLGLVGQIGVRAGNAELDAALKKLVAEALAPLKALNARAGSGTTQPAKQKVISLEGLLKDAPVSRRYRDLEIFEQTPGVPGEYRIRPGILRTPLRFGWGVLDPAGEVFYLPDKNVYYIQYDLLGSSTLHYYGPFKGNPKDIEFKSERGKLLWGRPVDGIRCAVRPLRVSFAPDEDITADIVYRNVSKGPITVCVCPDPFYTWVHLQVTTSDGMRVMVGQHGTGIRRPLKASDFVTLKPGQTARFRQVIAHPKNPSHRLKPGRYFLQAEVNKINRMVKHLPGLADFCEKHGIALPWCSRIESGKVPLTIATPPPTHPAGKGAGAEQLHRLWIALGSADTKVAHKAVTAMVAMGDRAVAFLAGRFEPPPAELERVKRLVAKLDSDKYAVRKKAHDELMKLGRAALPALKEALKQPKLWVEARVRIDGVVKNATSPPPDRTAQARRFDRALQVLEQIGTRRSKRMVTALWREEWFSWGKAAEGIRMRLRPAQPFLRPDGWPNFLVDCRNSGKHKVTLSLQRDYFRLQIDGVWYSPEPEPSTARRLLWRGTLSPGKEKHSFSFRPRADLKWRNEKNEPLAPVGAGRHTFRLAFAVSFENAAVNSAEVITNQLEVLVPPPGPDGASTQAPGSRLEFRIAPSLSALDKPRLATCRGWLKAGRVGFWWKSQPIAGRMPEHAWLPVTGELPKAAELVTGRYKGREYVLVSDKPGQTMLPGKGKNAWGLAKVYARTDSSGRPTVGFELDKRGAELFAAFTKANINNALAILVDGKVVSAPVLKTALGKQGMIPGRFTEQEVKALVKALKAGMPSNKLPAPNGASTQPGAGGKAGFGPVMERVINDRGHDRDTFLDLESGKLMVQGEEDARYDRTMSAEANRQRQRRRWARRSGADVMCHPYDKRYNGKVFGLLGFDMAMVRADANAWEFTPPRAAKALGSRIFYSENEMLTSPGKFPATFLVETRHGRIGVIQILGSTDSPRGVKLRYKLAAASVARAAPGPLWIALAPSEGTVRSLKELSILAEARDLNQAAARTGQWEIRTPDNRKRIGRIGYNWPIRPEQLLPDGKRIMGGTNRKGRFTLSSTQLRRIGRLAKGEHALAWYVAGKRCSNVVRFRIDKDYRSEKEPLLELASIEPAPGQALPLLVLRARRHKQDDPAPLASAVAFATLNVNGQDRTLSSFVWAGPDGPLRVAGHYAYILNLNQYTWDPKRKRKAQPLQPGGKHVIFARVGARRSNAVTLAFGRPPGKAWDQATAKLAPVVPPRVVLRGKVTGSDGKPAVRHRVDISSGGKHFGGEPTDANGRYRFHGIPAGRYVVTAHPKGMGQPELAVRNVALHADKTIALDLSLERKYVLAGQIRHVDGTLAAGMTVDLSCKDAARGAEFQDTTQTDALGRFKIGSPLGVVTYVGINGGRIDGRMPRLAPGRNVQDYVLRLRRGRHVAAPAPPREQGPRKDPQPAPTGPSSKGASTVRPDSPQTQPAVLDLNDAAKRLTKAVGGTWRVSKLGRATSLGGNFVAWHGMAVPYVVLPFPLDVPGYARLKLFQQKCSVALDILAADGRCIVLAGPSREPELTARILGTLGLPNTKHAERWRLANARAEWLDVRLAVARPSGAKLARPVPLINGPNIRQVKDYRKLFEQKGPNGGRQRGDPYQWFWRLPFCKVSPLLESISKQGAEYLLLSDRADESLRCGSRRPRPWNLKAVYATKDEQGSPAIGLEFDETAAAALDKMTRHNVNRPLAVLFSGKVLAVVTIPGPISDKLILSWDGLDKELVARIVRSLGECMLADAATQPAVRDASPRTLSTPSTDSGEAGSGPSTLPTAERPTTQPAGKGKWHAAERELVKRWKVPDGKSLSRLPSSNGRFAVLSWNHIRGAHGYTLVNWMVRLALVRKDGKVLWERHQPLGKLTTTRLLIPPPIAVGNTGLVAVPYLTRAKPGMVLRKVPPPWRVSAVLIGTNGQVAASRDLAGGIPWRGTPWYFQGRNRLRGTFSPSGERFYFLDSDKGSPRLGCLGARGFGQGAPVASWEKGTAHYMSVLVSGDERFVAVIEGRLDTRPTRWVSVFTRQGKRVYADKVPRDAKIAFQGRKLLVRVGGKVVRERVLPGEHKLTLTVRCLGDKIRAGDEIPIEFLLKNEGDAGGLPPLPSTIPLPGKMEARPEVRRAAARARREHRKDKEAMWKALAALIKPGMTVPEMKTVLPPSGPALVLWNGQTFFLTYPLDRDFGVQAGGIGKKGQLVLTAAPRVKALKKAGATQVEGIPGPAPARRSSRQATGASSRGAGMVRQDSPRTQPAAAASPGKGAGEKLDVEEVLRGIPILTDRDENHCRTR